jgi:hypothetical protein
MVFVNGLVEARTWGFERAATVPRYTDEPIPYTIRVADGKHV